MILSAAVLLALCALAFALLSVGGLALLHIDARRKRWAFRKGKVLGPFKARGTGPATASDAGIGLAGAARGFGPWVARVFGFNLESVDAYAVPWWAALGVTLLIAIGLARLGAGIISHLVWFMAPVLWVMFSRSFFGWCTRRRQDELFRQFPDALAMIVRAVRVGIPVTDSIAAVGREVAAPTGPEFARLSDELAIGITLEDALRLMAARIGLQEYRFFATALALQSQTGGGLSETLENLADVIRKRVAVRQKGEALSAEAKMSSIVLALLPPLAAVGLYVMNSAYIVLLFTDPLGQKILVTAAVTLGLGIMSMRTLIRKSLT